MAMDNSNSSNNLNHNIIDTPLYAQSKLTRKQAINEIANVILRSKMKPDRVKDILQLLQKFLPSNNTLPATIDELFGAMMSSENDWRLAQYLIKYKQSPSFSSSDTSNEESVSDASSITVREDDESDISSHSNDENNLTPYDRLQECLRPITEMATNIDLNYPTLLPLNININQRSQSTSDSINPSFFLDRFYQLISDTSSTSTNSIYHDDSDHEIPDSVDKFCCFEMNGYDLLNGGK